MSHSSSSSSFQSLFNAALQQYADQTGTEIDGHPIAQQLKACDSLDSISSVLQEHAQRFANSRGDDERIMKSLKPTIHVLYTLSTSAVLGEGTALVCPTALILILCPSCLPKKLFPPAKAVFAAFAILLAVRLFLYSCASILVTPL